MIGVTEIVVQVRSDADKTTATQFLDTELGRQLQPLFPGTTDTAMQSWYHLTLPVDDDPDKVVSELAGHPAVESAYVKPPDSQP